MMCMALVIGAAVLVRHPTLPEVAVLGIVLGPVGVVALRLRATFLEQPAHAADPLPGSEP